MHRQEVKGAIEAELTWLNGKGGEPEWPAFEPQPASPRHRLTLGKGRREGREESTRPERYTDHQAAALWLGNAANIFDVAKRPWLRDIVRAYSGWTSVANGSELEGGEDADRTPNEWNRAFYNLLAHCLPGLTTEQIDDVALAPTLALPAEAFLDGMTSFLRSVDAVYFSDLGLQEAQAVHIRNALAQRLMKTRDWEWQRRERSTSISTRLGPAIAVLLFNDFGSFQPAKCYLLEKGIDRLGSFLPVLAEVMEKGPFLFVATTLLNLLEVSPRPEHVPVMVAAGKLWFASHPDDREFWIDHAVGRRLCSVIEAIVAIDQGLFGPDQRLRKELDQLLAGLVRLGVPEAHLLEESLRLRQ